jgi:hypothetical protein
MSAAVTLDDLFLSYAWGKDGVRRPLARYIVAFLRANGYTVWFDEDHMSSSSAAQGGTDSAMATAIDASSAVVILLSPDYATSANCRKESDHADVTKKPTFFVNVEPGWVPSAYNTSDPTASAAFGWLCLRVGKALWADGRGGEAAWGAPGGGGGTLLSALRKLKARKANASGDAGEPASPLTPPSPAPTARTALRIPWAELHFERDEDGAPVVLGQGSFGSVVAATYSFARVAVKQLPAGRTLPASVVADFEAEAALQARLAHDHVVRVHGFAVSEAARPKYGVVMARLHEPLQEVLLRSAGGGGAPPPLAWRLSAVHQVAAGLAHLHARRVAHGDLKPANVMLTSPETGSLLQLTDFGLAREVGTGGSLRGTMGGGAARGTVPWMAPELLRAPEPGQPPARPSFRTDVYAWGVLAWQLLALAPEPYPGFSEQQVADAVKSMQRPDLAALPAGLPGALRSLISHCWDADPGARPRSGGDVLEALLEACPDAARVVPLPASGVDAAPAAPAPMAWRSGALVLPECPICAETQQPGVALGCGDAAHTVCLPCALQHIRAELGNAGSTMVHCPLCAPRDAPVAEAAAMEAHAWATAQGQKSGDLRPLSLQDLGRFAAMERSREEAAARAREEATLPAGMFKPCPNAACRVPIQHARGHHCHHISPGTGCTRCGTHFCYRCLRIYLPGESRTRCPTGCPLFCNETCDCPDCVDCKPGRPCEACDNFGVRGELSGRCWTCQPEKRPRPAAAAAAPPPAAAPAPPPPQPQTAAAPARQPAPPVAQRPPPPSAAVAGKHPHPLTPFTHGGHCNVCHARPGAFMGCRLGRVAGGGSGCDYDECVFRVSA